MFLKILYYMNIINEICMTNYIDTIGWIGNFCFIMGAILLAQKKLFGWMYQILGNLAYLIQGLFLQVSSLWALSGVLIGINLYGIYQWTKKPKKRKRNGQIQKIKSCTRVNI